ncbi:NDR1/HIN1-like protein 10 [Eucalyptus grandis]|uniref:NDR1/HIN1-like protein 10 n=1 Tax=Eucalyptus grandis TaxID=71139 RepID=UPI00192EC392|nr:NDR1/HIN1-like protein 10 [Eucalyptus grandis]XP_039170487.1 NDR1/HIN1-like protein 10 [Eucalyptus grandis]
MAGKQGPDCCCGLLKLLFEIILAVLISIGIAALIFWLIFRPVNLVKFHVTEAELTRFNLTTNKSVLNYNLKLNLTIRNPNKKIGVYYDRLEARAFYDDQRLSVADVAPFYQGHKNTSVVSPAFAGQKVVGSELSSFNKEKAAGVFDIKVKLYLRVRFKLGSLKTFRFKPKVKCDLNVPSSSKNGGSSANFQTTKCDIDWNIF